MEHLQIETSQNVDIEQTTASVGERMIAHFFDYLFFGLYLLFFSIAVNIFGSFSDSFWIILFIPIILYDLLCELMMDGQNWGKKIMKLKVVKIDGSQPDFISYFLRWVFRLVDNTLLFGSVATLTIILNGKGQRLGDLVANTTVIRIKKAASLKDTILVDGVESDYEPVIPEAINLTEKDVYVIKEVLDFVKENGYSGTAGKMLKESKKVLEAKLGITSNLPPAQFLKTLQIDYNVLNSSRAL